MEKLSLFYTSDEKAINRRLSPYHLIMACKKKQRRKRVARKKNQRGNGIRAFHTKNTLQRGYGMTIFRGESLQRGHGFGGILKGLFRIAVPIIRKSMVKVAPVIKRSLVKAGKKALKSAGKRALKAGVHAVKDINAKPGSFKERVRNEAVDAMESINRTGSKRKATRKPRNVKRRRVTAPTL